MYLFKLHKICFDSVVLCLHFLHLIKNWIGQSQKTHRWLWSHENKVQSVKRCKEVQKSQLKRQIEASDDEWRGKRSVRRDLLHVHPYFTLARAWRSEGATCFKRIVAGCTLHKCQLSQDVQNRKMARKFFVGGNWKMNGTKSEINDIVAFLKAGPLDPNVGKPP